MGTQASILVEIIGNIRAVVDDQGMHTVNAKTLIFQTMHFLQELTLLLYFFCMNLLVSFIPNP